MPFFLLQDRLRAPLWRNKCPGLTILGSWITHPHLALAQVQPASRTCSLRLQHDSLCRVGLREPDAGELIFSKIYSHLFHASKTSEVSTDGLLCLAPPLLSRCVAR